MSCRLIFNEDTKESAFESLHKKKTEKLCSFAKQVGCVLPFLFFRKKNFDCLKMIYVF